MLAWWWQIVLWETHDRSGRESNLGVEIGITTEVSQSKSSSVVLHFFILKDLLGRKILGVVEIERFLKLPKVNFESIPNFGSTFHLFFPPLWCFLSVTYYQTILSFYWGQYLSVKSWNRKAEIIKVK